MTERWYSTSNEDRRRKPIKMTLPKDVLVFLSKTAEKTGLSRSEIVEHLCCAAMAENDP